MTSALVLLLGVPFWEMKPPAQWTGEEIRELFASSPWAQTLTVPGGPPVTVYLATAGPLRDGEREAIRRGATEPANEARADYESFVQDRDGRIVVLAVSLTKIPRAADPELEAAFPPDELKRMEAGCTMRAGGRKQPMAGHFFPSAGDPWLRVVFPRPNPAGARELVFDLYVPLTTMPLRRAVFRLRDLMYKGRPAF